MTRAQESLHWRSWNAVVKANAWRMRKGFLLEEAAASRERSEHHRKVWVFAEQLAGRGVRAVTSNDLRHATYVAAIGRDCSHSEFTNKEFNAVLALWKLLVDPDDLTAVMEHQNPGEAARRGLIASIQRNAPGEAYIVAISTRRWGTRNWKTLNDGALRQLAVTLSERARKERKRVVVNAPF